MKILTLAPYAYFKGCKNFENNQSGLAYMITDIVNGLAESNDVCILTQSSITNGNKYNKIRIIRRRWIDIFSNIKFSYIRIMNKALNNVKLKFSYKLKCVLYFLSGGYAEQVIKKEKPDIVHIHSLGFYTLPFIMACVRSKVPFAVTLHGLISLSDSVKADYKQKNLEPNFLRLAQEKNIPVSVISTGIKNRIEEQLGVNSRTISVILNTVDENILIADEEKIKEIKSLYNITQNKKVILCIGGISERKNQLQVLRAFYLLDEQVKQNTVLLYIGSGDLNETLKQEINKLNLNDKVFMCGKILRKDMCNYYSLADLNVTASIDEGFGLPMLEAYQYGVPTVTFKDLDAVLDIYNDQTMITVNERTDQALSDGLLEGLKKEWDRDFIISFSKNFTFNKMSDEYNAFLSNVKLSNTTILDVENLVK